MERNILSQHTESFEVFFEVYNKYDFRDAEWFGGVYSDDCGDICMKVVEGHQWDTCRENIMRELDVGRYIRFEKAKYSFRRLSGLCGEILSDPGNIDRGIVGAGIDEKNNKITLAVTDSFQDHRTLYGGDEFSVLCFERLRNDISVQPADTLTNKKCFFTAGYPAKNNKNIHGIVTAGHLTDIQNDMPVFLGEYQIGSVCSFEFSDTMDAAFIRLSGNNSCSDTVSVTPYPTINDLAPNFICGTAVHMYSQNSGLARTGTVAYRSFDFMNIKNIVVFTYSAAVGDSGAPILIPFDKEDHRLAGIHIGTFFMGGKVYSYGITAQDINKHLLLEPDIKTKRG